MRKYLVFETVRPITSSPHEVGSGGGNVNKESAVSKSFASLTTFQHINNLSLAKLELSNILPKPIYYETNCFILCDGGCGCFMCAGGGHYS